MRNTRKFERLKETDIVPKFSTYAELVSHFSSIAPVEAIGKDSSGMDIKGFRLGSGLTNKPKVVVFNLHASEWMAVHSLILFAKKLKETSFIDVGESSSLLRRFNWIFVPTICPWSYENTSYKSFNGVNINRNFDQNWSISEARSNDAASSQYGGTAAESEPETKAICNLIRAEKPLLVIDCHTNGSSEGGVDTGNFYGRYDLMLTRVLDELQFLNHPQKYWNSGYHPTSLGWGGKQSTNQSSRMICTILEGCTLPGIPQLETEQYVLNAIKRVALEALRYQENRMKLS